MSKRITTRLRVEAEAKGRNDKKRFRLAAKRLVRAAKALARGRVLRGKKARRTKSKKNQGGNGGP